MPGDDPLLIKKASGIENTGSSDNGGFLNAGSAVCEKFNTNSQSGLQTDESNENEQTDKKLNGFSDIGPIKPVDEIIADFNDSEKACDDSDGFKSADDEPNNFTENIDSNELCNGLSIPEAGLESISNSPLPNGDTVDALLENVDSTDDFDVDELYDSIENRKSNTNYEQQKNLTEGSPIPTGQNETDDQKPKSSSTDEMDGERKEGDNLNNSHGESFEIGTEDEEMLLKSPSMAENDANLPNYSESVLLKESFDEKDITEIKDDDDDDDKDEIVDLDSSNENSESANQFNQTEPPIEKSSEPTSANNVVESDEANDNVLSTNHHNDALGKECNNDEKSTNANEQSESEPEKLSISKSNDKSSDIIEQSAVVPESVEMASKSHAESIENQENKENNLLEEMDGSPASLENCLEESSSRECEANDDENESNGSIIDLKDENSMDARDGFDDKNAIDQALEDVTPSNEKGTHESNDVTDISLSNDVSTLNQSNDDSSIVFTDTVDLQDSFEKLRATCDVPNDTTDTPMTDKSADKVITLDDDDDVIFTDIEKSVLIPETVSEASELPNNNVEQAKDQSDQPPAKRMRISQSETDEMTTSPEDRVEAVESDADQTMSKSIPDQPENNENKHSFIDEDDDILIIESSEVKRPNINSSSIKRSATPIEDDTRKKFKISSVEEMPEKKNDDEKIDTKPSTDQDIKIENIKKADEELETEYKLDSVEKELIKSETVKTELKPLPEKVQKRTIALEFAEKFKRDISEMSRKNLEEFVLEKIIEAIVHKSEYSDLKKKTEAQEQMIQAARTKLQEMNKQYRDLEMVYTRIRKDLEHRNQSIVTPIKITRAVGLQVCLQKTAGKEATSSATTIAAVSSKAPQKLQTRSIATAPAAGSSRLVTVSLPRNESPSKVLQTKQVIQRPSIRPIVRQVVTRQTPTDQQPQQQQRLVTTGNENEI